MSDDNEQQYRRLRLKKALEDLQGMKGMGTELVSVVIPPDRKIHDVRQQLSQEAGQAANIKSKSTKKHVQDAIESAIATLNRHTTPGERHCVICWACHSRKQQNKADFSSRRRPPERFSHTDIDAIQHSRYRSWKRC